MMVMLFSFSLGQLSSSTGGAEFEQALLIAVTQLLQRVNEMFMLLLVSYLILLQQVTNQVLLFYSITKQIDLSPFHPWKRFTLAETSNRECLTIAVSHCYEYIENLLRQLVTCLAMIQQTKQTSTIASVFYIRVVTRISLIYILSWLPCL